VYGQLGNGTTENPGNLIDSTPSPVPGLANATQLSVGAEDVCALVGAGNVECWGDNTYGELGNNSTTSSLVPTEVDGLTQASGISAGGNEACASLDDGDFSCWGQNRGKISTLPVLIDFPPAQVTKTVVKVGNGSVNVRFESPALDGGSVITGYEAFLTNPSTSPYCITSGTQCTISGLKPGSTHKIWVIARNSDLTSDWSLAGTVKIPRGAQSRKPQQLKTITCVKGKTVKQFKALNPYCPNGYRLMN
jgi:hypothetical protein